MSQSTHKPRSDLSVIILHWLTVAMVVTSLATGAQIAADRHGTLAGIWASWLRVWPEGAVIHWHLLSGWVIISLLLAYLSYIFKTGQWRKLVAKEKIAGGTVRWAANLSSISSILALISLAITGTWLFLGSIFSNSVLQWHAVLATFLVILTILHILVQVVAGRFWALWRIRWQRLVVGLLSITVAVAVVASTGLWLSAAHQSLEVEYRKAAVNLDGVADENIWSSLKPVTVTTNHGSRFDEGQTDVTVRGFHDGMSAFFLVQWADTTHSQLHLPLERTALGWRLLSAGIAQDDETEFYEDKLALAWSDTQQLASAFTHHGQNLVPGLHRPVTRGLHYTTDGSMLDLWHWKSVRTGQQLPPRLDDNHIGPPIPSTFVGQRYTGGYQPDLGGAGYSLNVCLRDDPDCLAVLKRVHETGEYEPVPGSARQRLQQCINTPLTCESLLIPILIPKQPSNGSGMLTSATAHIWSKNLEKNIALGERVPGVVIDGRLSSGRGDVRAAGGWQEGVWTLEIRRALTTRDNKDINFMPGLGTRYLWVAPFDGSQTRHAHHLQPIKVEFKQPLN